jgi:hypothetical protein
MSPRLLPLAVALAVVAYAAPAASAAVHLTPIGDFTVPVYVTAPPGDPSRLFVVEKEGRIREVRDGQVLGAPFLNIVADATGNGEQGLLSMAFAPDYATSRKFYIYYTAPRPGDSNGSIITIQEFQTVAGNPDAVDPASRRTILTIQHPSNTNHDGGQIQFGPDGGLYTATGDGGSISVNVSANAQNPASQLGKVLKIDPATGVVEQRALGLRNPFRFSFDRQTGDMVMADVGEGSIEEVDFSPGGAPMGANYGWNCLEGRQTTGRCPSPPPGAIPPVLEKNHGSDGFCAIIGGYVARDPALGALNGRYLYGDNCASAIRSASLVAPPGTVTDDADTGLRVDGLTSFGEDSCGHVYTTSGGGTVARIDGDTFTPCGKPDTRAPVARIGGPRKQRIVRQRGARITLSCDETCGVTVRGKARIGRSRTRYVLRGVARRVTANKRVTVKLRMSKRARRAIARALRRHRRVKVSVSVSARDAAGNESTTGRTIVARR